MPGIGRMLSGRRLRRVKQAQRTGAELNCARNSVVVDIVKGGKDIPHGFGANTPFQRAVDVGVELLGQESGLSSRARCSPKSVHPVYWNLSSFLPSSAGSCALPIRVSNV